MAFVPQSRRSSLEQTSSSTLLSNGSILKWQGPSLSQNILLSTDPRYRKQRSHPRAEGDSSIHELLLSEEGPARGSTPWQIKLTSPLKQERKVANAQVWSATAYSRNHPGQTFEIILKLYVRRSLEDCGRLLGDLNADAKYRTIHHQTTWIEGANMVDREVLAYSFARQYQDHLIPINYGVYPFHFDNGEVFEGFVLGYRKSVKTHEPLLSVAEWIQRERTDGTLTSDNFDRVMLSTFRTLELFQPLHIALKYHDLNDYLLLESGQVLRFGFSHAQPREEIEKGFRNGSSKGKDWFRSSRKGLRYVFAEALENGYEWVWQESKLAQKWENRLLPSL